MTCWNWAADARFWSALLNASSPIVRRSRNAIVVIKFVVIVIIIIVLKTIVSEQYSRSNNCKAPFTRYNLLSNRLYTRYNRLSNPLSNRLYNPVWQPVERTAVRSTRLSNWLSNPFDNGCQTGCQTRLTTGMTTGWMFVYTIQPVVKPDVQLVWQPVVSCKRGLSCRRQFRIIVILWRHVLTFFKVKITVWCTAHRWTYVYLSLSM